MNFHLISKTVETQNQHFIASYICRGDWMGLSFESNKKAIGVFDFIFLSIFKTKKSQWLIRFYQHIMC